MRQFGFIHRGVLGAWLFAAAACGGHASGAKNPPPESGPKGPVAPVVTRIREGFDNHDFVESSDGVEIDFNKGRVRLPAEVFPEISSDQLMQYTGEVEQNGTLMADRIRLSGNLRASDSIELLAQDVLRVSGNIQAGTGGVTLAAGKQIFVDGVIESEGPVKVLLANESGSIEINGRIMAITSIEKHSANVRIISRGRVLVTGQVTTGAENGLVSGNITVDAYGPIEVRGPSAAISARVKDFGPSGRVQLKSVADVTLDDGASIGGDTPSSPRPPDPSQRGLQGTGDVEIQAERTITIGTDCKVTAVSSVYSPGGSLLIMAGSGLVTKAGSVIASGSGLSAGSLTIQTSSARLGAMSTLSAGNGLQTVKLTRIETSKGLMMDSGATVTGGEGLCTNGGAVRIEVGGSLVMAPGASIQGGAGGATSSALGCAGLFRAGGDVDVLARAAQGIEGAIRGGAGATSGQVRTAIDPWFVHAGPNLTVTTAGWVESRVIDRGEAAVGQRPILVEAKLTRPVGTKVEILLAGAESEGGPFTDWEDLLGRPTDASRSLEKARYFRYHLALHGRAFDTPTATYFDIDLAPKNPPAPASRPSH